MTASNHALTGAIIAVAVKQPLLVVPLAFVSHFALDALPHFGFPNGLNVLKNRRTFWTVFSVDMLFLTVIFLNLPFIDGTFSPAMFLSMFAAISPDLVWGMRLFRELRKLPQKPKTGLTKFHSAIQRYERPWGLVIEMIWLVSSLILFKCLR